MKHQTGNNMAKSLSFLCFSLCLIFTSQLSFADLTATVDRTQITESDVLRLSIRLENQSSNRQLDFTPLQKDFEILGLSGPNRSTSIRSVNGRNTRQTSTSWELNLRAKRRGLLTIPSLQIAGLRTQLIAIDVIEQSAANKRQVEQFVFFETTVDQDKIYVQAEVIYTVRLFYRENINGTMSTPEIDNAIIETLEAENRYDTVVNGRRYYVLEKQYAIYPQSSGLLTIPRQTFSGSRVGRGFFSRSEPVMTLSNEHRVNVLTKPAVFQGQDWLPAKALSIKQAWSQSPPQFVVGEPLNRTLTIEALGIAATMLPDFDDLKIDGLKIYPDPAVDKQAVGKDGLYASRSITIGMVPTRAGTLVLPAIEIHWWNTVTNQEETATIPASSFEVLPAAADAPVTVAPIADTQRFSQQPKSISGQTATALSGNPFWLYTSGILLLLWLTTLFMYFKKPKAATVVKDKPKVAIDADQLFKQLISACESNQPGPSHAILLKWAKFYSAKTNSSKIGSIQQLAGKHTGLKTEILALEQQLYGGAEDLKWDGTKLGEALKSLNKQKPAQGRNKALEQQLIPS